LRIAAVRHGLLAVVIVAFAVGCGDTDERAIRNQMSAVAESLTVPENDGELGRVARIATLRNLLAPDIAVSTGAPRPGAEVPPELVGRDAVLALAGRWVPPAGGVTIEFVDMQVTMDAGRSTAQVYCTARISSGPDDRPLVDARELTIGFARIDGSWLIASVRPEDTLVR
jgi:hypothetical protein